MRSAIFLVFCFFWFFLTSCKNKIFQQLYQKTLPKLLRSRKPTGFSCHLLPKQLLSSAIHHSAVFKRWLNTLKPSMLCQIPLEEPCLEEFKELYGCPPSSPALGLFAVTWGCRHCLHTFSLPPPPAQLSSQGLVTDCTDEGC